jgi:hypothetical protein
LGEGESTQLIWFSRAKLKASRDVFQVSCRKESKKVFAALDSSEASPLFAGANDGAENTRFSEFPTGVLSKGVWWMPRLKKAMKDAAQQRYASGRCLATFDPEISEWGNPIERTSITLFVTEELSRPREVKHLSTERKREQ